MAELLSMIDVCVSYGRQDRRVEVLKHVSLSVAAGEIGAVVGAFGAGRTTLLSVARGLERSAVNGEVRFAGIDLMHLSEGKLVRLWGDRILWLDQEPPPFSSKAYRYIAMSLLIGRRCKRRDADRLAWEALERIDASGCGLRSWETLSTWEALLVKFACVVAMRPELVLVDGLFDGLGSRQTYEASQLLGSIVDEVGCGVLLGVTDPESALAADRVWSLDEGRLTCMSDEMQAPSNMVALAAELHARGYKDAAAVITGSALEQHLRRLAVKSRPWIERDDVIPQGGEAINHALVAAGVYNRLQQKSVTAWLDLRNKSVHGHYSTYDSAQVLGLIRDVRDFMTRFPA
jgi:ABC-type lipoprotein export system ATPase subunit